MNTEGPHGIQRLILDRKGERTYDRLARDCGGTPTLNRLQGLATKPIKSFPDPESIEGLSRGLNVGVTDVLMACAVSLGLHVTAPGPDALVLHGAGRLSTGAQDSLVEVSRQMQVLAGV